MKKITKVITACSIGFLFFQSQAQNIAVKGGFNLAKIVNDDEFVNSDIGFTSSFKPGFHLGATVDLPINKMFSVETGLFASTSGVKYSANFEEFEGLYEYQIGLNIFNAELPVIFKSTFEVGDDFNVYIGAGGYGAISLFGVVNSRMKIGSDIEKDSETINFEDFEDNRFDAGLRFEAGVELKGLIIGTSCNFGLLPTVLGGQNRIIKLSLGYRFGWDKA
jgi:hypothetical protein